MLKAILLLGPTGSGKSPLGDALQREGLHGRSCHHFDFGENLRAVATSTPDSHFTRADLEFINDVLTHGALLEAHTFHIAEKIFARFVASRGIGGDEIIILNGLPRHEDQARAMAHLCAVVAVIQLTCDAQTVFDRITTNSGGDRTSRTDDALALIHAKLCTYNDRTLPLVAHYQKLGVPVLPRHVGIETTPAEIISSLPPL